MKLDSFFATGIIALLVTTAPGYSHGAAQEEVLMPEVKVSGEAVDRPHPEDSNYSERPLGCAEVVTPRGTGNESGGYFQARFAKHGIPVIPNLNDPRSASDYWRRGPAYDQSPKTPPGQEGKPGCAK